MLIRVDRADLMLHLPALQRASDKAGEDTNDVQKHNGRGGPPAYSEQCITLAASLADRFGARLIGAAAEVEFVPVYPEAPVADALLIDTERKRVAGDVEKAESLFRRIAGSRTAVQWRCGAQEPRTFLLENARAADLIVLGRQGQGDDTDWRFGVRPGDVVMELGRPILVVPPGIVNCSARRVIFGWKNTRRLAAPSQTVCRSCSNLRRCSWFARAPVLGRNGDRMCRNTFRSMGYQRARSFARLARI